MFALIIIFFFLFSANLINADIIWPGLIYIDGILQSFPYIIFGFIVEFLIIQYGTKLSFKKAFIIVLLMNLVSFLLGIILIPIATIFLEIIYSISVYQFFKIGTFSLITQISTFIIIVAINTIIESWIILLKYPKFNEKKIIILVTIANALSTAIAVFGIYKMQF